MPWDAGQGNPHHTCSHSSPPSSFLLVRANLFKHKSDHFIPDHNPPVISCFTQRESQCLYGGLKGPAVPVGALHQPYWPPCYSSDISSMFPTQDLILVFLSTSNAHPSNIYMASSLSSFMSLLKHDVPSEIFLTIPLK